MALIRTNKGASQLPASITLSLGSGGSAANGELSANIVNMYSQFTLSANARIVLDGVTQSDTKTAGTYNLSDYTYNTSFGFVLEAGTSSANIVFS